MHTLVLSPSTSFANPRSWEAVSRMNIPGLYDEVHCMGGGSLLLFLLACADKSPRLRPGGRVILHGPLVYPTPDSCKEWLKKENQDLEDVDAHEWRKAALSLGVGGLMEHDQWLEPIVRSVTSGRHGELVDRYETLKCKTEDKGRLVHLMPDGPTPVLASYEKELIRDSVEHKKLEQVLVKCGEFECVQLDGDSSVTFRA